MGGGETFNENNDVNGGFHINNRGNVIGDRDGSGGDDIKRR